MFHSVKKIKLKRLIIGPTSDNGHYVKYFQVFMNRIDCGFGSLFKA
jgi:hypothetical protein